MHNKEFHISSLIAGYLRGQLNPQQEQDLNAWLNASQANRNYFDELTSEEALSEKLKEYHQANTDPIWDKTMLKVKGIDTSHKTTTKIINVWFKIAAAAAILMVVGTGLWFFYTSRHPDASQDPGHTMFTNDIAPGTNKATLTLANGQKLSLSDAKTGIVIDASKLTYNDGSDVRVSSKTESLGSQKGSQSLRGFSGDPLTSAKKQLTASTPRGGTYQVILSDGTHIWLNAASSIKFPSSFANLKERKVELSGEAYFIVKHNAKQPFRVQTNGQIVEDIGTEFNINSYVDETATKTTLIEGAARVVSTQVQNDVVLKPRQQSSLISSGNIKVTEVDIQEEIAWKNGTFIFHGENLESVMRKVARWYDVEIIYTPDAPKDMELFGYVSRSRSISAVLEHMERTGNVKFKVEGRKITVMKQ